MSEENDYKKYETIIKKIDVLLKSNGVSKYAGFEEWRDKRVDTLRYKHGEKFFVRCGQTSYQKATAPAPYKSRKQVLEKICLLLDIDFEIERADIRYGGYSRKDFFHWEGEYEFIRTGFIDFKQINVYPLKIIWSLENNRLVAEAKAENSRKVFGDIFLPKTGYMQISMPVEGNSFLAIFNGSSSTSWHSGYMLTLGEDARRLFRPICVPAALNSLTETRLSEPRSYKYSDEHYHQYKEMLGDHIVNEASDLVMSFRK